MSEITSANTSQYLAWLKAVGFNRDPFETVEADRERDLLPQLFVPVDGYDQIQNSQTTIVFAPRGGGKSALRVMIAQASAPAKPDVNRLALEYTDFHELVSKVRAGQPIHVADHLGPLLRAGGQALFEAFFGFQEVAATAGLTPLRAARAATLTTPDLWQLARFARQWAPAQLDVISLFDYVQQLHPHWGWEEFYGAWQANQLAPWAQTQAGHPALLRLLQLSDLSRTLPAAAPEPLVQQFKDFVRLVQRLKFDHLMVLVDRLDEYEETPPEVQLALIQALLVDLHINEIPGLSFKFFLPHETHALAARNPLIRFDRLGDVEVKIKWEKAHLLRLLESRLRVFSADKVPSLDALCVERAVAQGKEPAPFAAWLEEELLRCAQGSPRYLLLAAQTLCRTHFQRAPEAMRLEPLDWELAREEFLHKFPPLLHIRKHARLIRLGSNPELEVTKLEHQILIYLSEKKGHCTRDELAEVVWGGRTGVSNEAIDQRWHGLKAKLGGGQYAELYLHKTSPDVFALANYVLE